MSQLRPTLWRTCRTVANEVRLQLLWLLFKKEALCVTELAEKTGMSEPNTSIQLRALNARGLISRHKQGLKVFYHPEANTDVEHAELLLDALRHCCQNDMAFSAVIRMATAFTHERRIHIIRTLHQSPSSFEELRQQTGIPPASLSHHLAKLEARGFVRRKRRKYYQATPSNPFGRILKKAVCAPISPESND